MKHNKNIIRKMIRNIICENIFETWYHGSPDSMGVKINNRFSKKNISVDYIVDIEKYEYLQ
jgi:hypothetical protein